MPHTVARICNLYFQSRVAAGAATHTSHCSAQTQFQSLLSADVPPIYRACSSGHSALEIKLRPHIRSVLKITTQIRQWPIVAKTHVPPKSFRESSQPAHWGCRTILPSRSSCLRHDVTVNEKWERTFGKSTQRKISIEQFRGSRFSQPLVSWSHAKA